MIEEPVVLDRPLPDGWTIRVEPGYVVVLTDPDGTVTERSTADSHSAMQSRVRRFTRQVYNFVDL